MNKDDFYLLGYIKKAVKNNGELIIFLDVDDPDSYGSLQGFLIEMSTGLVPFFVECIHIRENGDAVVKLEGINNEEDAAALKGKSIWLPIESLPKLTGNRFYYHEVIGWRVIDKQAGEIGIIKDILDNTSQPLFQIIHPSGTEILIPIHDDILEKVDRSAQIVYITSPEGLLDLFLQ